MAFKIACIFIGLAALSTAVPYGYGSHSGGGYPNQNYDQSFNQGYQRPGFNQGHQGNVDPGFSQHGHKPGFNPGYNVDPGFNQGGYPNVKPGFNQGGYPNVDPGFNQGGYSNVGPGFNQVYGQHRHDGGYKTHGY